MKIGRVLEQLDLVDSHPSLNDSCVGDRGSVPMIEPLLDEPWVVLEDAVLCPIGHPPEGISLHVACRYSIMLVATVVIMLAVLLVFLDAEMVLVCQLSSSHLHTKLRSSSSLCPHMQH